jgi:integrase
MVTAAVRARSRHAWCSSLTPSFAALCPTLSRRSWLVSRNVAKRVKIQALDYEVGTGLDPIAAKTLLEILRDNRLFALYLCALVLGMRRGELLGLTWDAAGVTWTIIG